MKFFAMTHGGSACNRFLKNVPRCKPGPCQVILNQRGRISETFVLSYTHTSPFMMPYNVLSGSVETECVSLPALWAISCLQWLESIDSGKNNTVLIENMRKHENQSFWLC